MREIDRLTTEKYGVPSLLLMENAARAALRETAARCGGTVRGKRALVLCGRGNNGGDGAALSRLLCLEGALVSVVLLGRVEDSNGDARVNFEIVRRLAAQGEGGGALEQSAAGPARGRPLFASSPGSLRFAECPAAEDWRRLRALQTTLRADVYVDAIFGTGLTRPAEGLYREAIDFLLDVREEGEGRGRAGLVVSLDLPSGLGSDAGHPTGPAVRADLTVTFSAPKPANVLAPADALNGELVVADIGSPSALIEESPSKLFLTEAADAQRWLRRTRFTPDSYKNTHGHALVVAGSRDMTGAAALCAEAALRAGAGLVTAATAASAAPVLAARLAPEVMTAPLAETADGAVSAEALARASRLAERATVIAVGCGLSHADESTRRFVRELVAGFTRPVVLDADGLNALAPWPPDLKGMSKAPLVLTPHEGEMLRLLGTADRGALRERVRVAGEFARAHSLILVLKGARTLVAAPDGRVFVNPTGNAGLGTGGTGDTLTGVITGFLAQEFGTFKEQADALGAVVAAVYVAGLAGDLAARERGMRALVASDVRNYLGAAVRALDPEGETP
jgi:ADP-dependent NAD(P)H-hydrate dehydratase / NAD(P)H-hydrate epimerase